MALQECNRRVSASVLVNLDRSTGLSSSPAAFPSHRGVAALAFSSLEDGIIYVTGADRQVVALDASSGNLQSKFEASKHPLSCLAIAPGWSCSWPRLMQFKFGTVKSRDHKIPSMQACTILCMISHAWSDDTP